MFDITYIIFIAPFALYAMYASFKVKSTYENYSKLFVNCGMKAQDAARMMLNENGLSNIRIETIRGQLTDHYDPRNKVIRLSEAVFNSSSCAAIGVACHEVGHAIQDAQNYAPLRLRNAIIPLTNLGSTLSFPLILIGFMISPTLSYIGIGLFGFSVLFQLFTLPTEFDASKRALISLKNSKLLTQNELFGAKNVLDAAALTYVAALATSIGQFVRLIVIVLSNQRRRD